jgi:tetratricopeptide (TPR) repeat protein
MTAFQNETGGAKDTPGQSPAGGWRLGVLVLLVCGAVAAGHWPALSARALSFDDYQYLVENPLVRSPGWESARRFLTEVLNPSTVGGYYQPLAMISLMLDCGLGGGPDQLEPFHRTSLLLHVANTALVIVLLHRMFGDALSAGLVGLLFGLHPLTVEPIPWVGERKTLLAAFFSLGSLLAYVRYARRPRAATYLVVGGLYVAALLSKPTSTALPLMMLLMDAWPLRRFARRAIAEKVPLLAVAAGSAVVTYLSQAATFVETPGEHGIGRIVLTVCHNAVFYLYQLAWPVELSSHYAFPEPLDLSDGMVRAGVIGTPILISLLLGLRRWTPAPLVSWLMFFVMLFPTMGVVGFTIVIASDKYAYLPAIGLLMLLAAGLTRLRANRGAAVRAALLCAALGIAGAEAVGTRRYLACWQTTEALYGNMLAHCTQPGRRGGGGASFLRFGLGHYYQANGRTQEAMREYRRALELNPEARDPRNNLGLLLADCGAHEEAIGHYRVLLERYPLAADVHNNLGLSLAATGRLEEAVGAYREALRQKPEYVPALNNLGMARGMQNRVAEALDYFQRALVIRPGFVEARNNLAAGLWRLGRLDEARAQYEELARQQPGAAEPHVHLGRVLALQGRWPEAEAEYLAALARSPDNEEARAGLDAARSAKRTLP